jgi:hypothetical protein
MTVQLEFVGHACFRLWEDGRPSIVMDPFSHWKTELVDDGFRLDADTVIVARHHTMTFPTTKSEDGRPTIVVLEPSGYQPTGGFPGFRVPAF